MAIQRTLQLLNQMLRREMLQVKSIKCLKLVVKNCSSKKNKTFSRSS